MAQPFILASFNARSKRERSILARAGLRVAAGGGERVTIGQINARPQLRKARRPSILRRHRSV